MAENNFNKQQSVQIRNTQRKLKFQKNKYKKIKILKYWEIFLRKGISKELKRRFIKDPNFLIQLKIGNRIILLSQTISEPTQERQSSKSASIKYLSKSPKEIHQPSNKAFKKPLLKKITLPFIPSLRMDLI